MKKYASDFETIVDKNDCRVWAWASCDIYDHNKVTIGNSIDTFMEYIKKGNQEHYFHNLKFDGEFIIYWLLTHGFTYSEEKLDNTFNCLISNVGQFYQIEVVYKVYDHRLWHTVFYDSMKKLPFSVDVIAKAFELENKKLTLDYNKKREVNHKLTVDEIAYISNDVKIVAEALKIQFDVGLKKMTIGADALHNFKKLIGKKKFSGVFPIFTKTTDNDIRQAYRGGFTYVNPKYQEKIVKNGGVYDINSMYPSIMYNELLPYDLPIFFNGKYEEDKYYPLYIQRIACSFKLKKGKIPCIQLKNNMRYSMTEYITTSNDEIEILTLTNIDEKMFFENYEVKDLEYICGYKFKGLRGIFKDYIDYWIKEKNENTGAKRQIAKLMLNSLYGKFATNTDVTGKIPYLDDDDIVHYKKGETKEREPIYTPIAIFITSYGRDKIIRTAEALGDHFVYCDTDSVHVINISEDEISKIIEIDNKKLGAFKCENKFDIGKFIRPKTYIEINGSEKIVKCAGLPEKLKEYVTLENFNKGLSIHGKLLPKHVKGGIVLEETDFTIK